MGHPDQSELLRTQAVGRHFDVTEQLRSIPPLSPSERSPARRSIRGGGARPMAGPMTLVIPQDRWVASSTRSLAIEPSSRGDLEHDGDDPPTSPADDRIPSCGSSGG